MPLVLSCTYCSCTFPAYAEGAGEWVPSREGFAVWLCSTCARHVGMIRAAETEDFLEAEHRKHCPHCGGNDDDGPPKPPTKLKLVPPVQ